MGGTPGATAGSCRNAPQSVAQQCERSWGGWQCPHKEAPRIPGQGADCILEGDGELWEGFEQESDEAGFAASSNPLWLLLGVQIEGRESSDKEPSAFKVRERDDEV